MNDSDLRQLADAVAQVLRPHLERSEALRRTAGLIGKWLCEEAERIGPGVAATNEPIASDQSVVAESIAGVPATPEGPGARAGDPSEPPQRPAAAPRVLPMSSGIVPLKLGDTLVHVPLSGTTQELGRARLAAIEPKDAPDAAASDFADRTEIDLAMIEERCRLKAASCRLFVEKRAAAGDPDREYEVRQRMNKMIADAKAKPDCFLWVFWRERTPPDDAALVRIP